MIMKKQPQKRSPRYRFWRKVGLMTAAGLIGGGLGVLTGMFGSEKPLKFNLSLVKKYSIWDL